MECKQGAISLIDSIINTITVIDYELYRQPLSMYNGSTFGKHFRHIYDFFHCLIHQCGHPNIDYCNRSRDIMIEEQKDYCIQAFQTLQTELANLDEGQLITVKADFEIPNGSRPAVKTSIGREIMYAYDHAVHHLAIIKIGLNQHCAGLQINQDLGVAASTIRYNTFN